MLGLYFALYDLLLDDDEDVRDSAAAVVSKLRLAAVSRNNAKNAQLPLVAPATRHKLLEFLEVQYHDSAVLWAESMQRLIGVQCMMTPNHKLQDSQKGLGYPLPSALLEDLNQEDTTLFVEEKQNLYIDEAQEAGIWQQVLLRMDRTAVNVELLRQVRAWATDGVEALIDTAEKESAGPLGWTSKPDVFTFGVRVLLTAEALIRLSDDEGFGINGDGLQDRLQRSLLVGEWSSLHPTWLRMIRTTLGHTG